MQLPHSPSKEAIQFPHSLTRNTRPLPSPKEMTKSIQPSREAMGLPELSGELCGSHYNLSSFPKEAGGPTYSIRQTLLAEDPETGDVPDWKLVDQINSTDPPIGRTLLPPTSTSASVLAEMHLSAQEEVPEHLKSVFSEASARLSMREQIALSRLLTVYGDVFSRNKTDLGLFTLLTHRIHTYNEEPVKERLRRTPLKFQVEEEKTLNDMIAAGVVEPSFSEWASAPVLVRKKDGEVRYTVDFRQLNTKTVKDAYPLPLIDECTDTLSGNLWFHTLDLASGYWQIAIDPKHRHKTAFLTKYGLFQHVRMAQGLCNAPATFQRVMHLVLRGLTWNKALVYLDDIIVMGKTFSDSLENLEVVLQRVRAHGLKLKPKKCQLFRTKVQFLGRIVSREGVAVTDDHIKCIREWPAPKNPKDVEKFLGFVNYHRDFLQGLATILSPLYALTRKDTPFRWTQECERAFQTAKDSLTSAPVLAYPNNEDHFILDTDASDIALGAALYQVQQGDEKPISFASMTLTPAQRKYCTTRKELLAVVVFTRRFRHYLLGRHFVVRTDHGSLTWLCRFKDPCGQLGRWLEELAQYNMTVQHRAGNKHINADSLSRIPASSPTCNHYTSRGRLADLPCGGCTYCSKLHEQWARFEEEVDFVSPYLAEACTTETGKGTVTNLSTRRISCETGPSQNDTKPNYLEPFTPKELREMQLADPEILPVITWLEQGEPTKEELFSHGFTTKWLWRHRSHLAMVNGVLHYKWVEPGAQRHRLVVPIKEREEIIRLSHDTRTGGHWGRDKTVSLVSKGCYWPTMRRDIELYVSSCDICSRQKNKPKNRAHLANFQAGLPGERIHMDYMGPFPVSSSGNRYVLVIIDQFTKWIEICAVPSQSADVTADTLVKVWISRFGMPRIIHTDQGRTFESHLFRELCRHLEIQKTRTTAYRPSSNGQVERYNQQVASFIRCFLGDKAELWDNHLDLLGMSLRATVSRATGMTPNLMCLGREVDFPVDILYGLRPESDKAPPEYVRTLLDSLSETFNKARIGMKSSQRYNKLYYDKDVKIRDSKFNRGDLVVLLNSATKIGQCKKLQAIWKGPYVVSKVLSPTLYQVKDRHRTMVHHVDRMRVYNGRSVPLWISRRRTQLMQEEEDPDDPDDDDLGQAFGLLFSEQPRSTSLNTVNQQDTEADDLLPGLSAGMSLHSHDAGMRLQNAPDTAFSSGASTEQPRDGGDLDATHPTDDSNDSSGGGMHLPCLPRRTRTGRLVHLPGRFRDFDVT